MVVTMTATTTTTTTTMTTRTHGGSLKSRFLAVKAFASGGGGCRVKKYNMKIRAALECIQVVPGDNRPGRGHKCPAAT